MSYEMSVQFSHIWGLLLAFALFSCALAYALWPRNQAKFDHAKRLPLEENDDV